MKKTPVFSLIMMVFITACGGQSTPSQPTSTTIPTYNYVSPTPNAQIATAIATETTQAAADAQTIAQGRDRYVALTCGECHGDNGQGTEKGSVLVGYVASQADFITFLRTGGKLGSAHQYASNKLSDRGAQNLYAYLKSLTS
jgi:mono/diheme cytochrome c family protein